MFFFEYIIKLLMGNSNSLFAGLIIVVFGYYGWLLWHINDNLSDFLKGWGKHEGCLQELKTKMDNLDESIYRELIVKLNENMSELDKVNRAIEENESSQNKNRDEIIREIKESSDEIKEIMKILLNHRFRGLEENIKK